MTNLARIFPKNVEIDRLRAITMLLVVYFHFKRGFLDQNLSLVFGTTGVDIWFVISGYVISKTLTPHIEAASHLRQFIVAIKNFYLRRFFRVYPVAWVVFFLSWLLPLILNSHHLQANPVDMAVGFHILTGTFNYYFLKLPHSIMVGPYWALMVEEQFYLFIPLFIWLSTNQMQRSLLLLYMLGLSIFIIRPFSLQAYGMPAVFFTQCRCDGLMYGCLLYLCSQHNYFKKLQQKYKHSFQTNWLYSKKNMIYLLLVTSLYYCIIKITTLNLSLNVILSVGIFLAAILVFLAVLEINIISFPFFIQKWLDVLGIRTYSLYLVHWPCVLLMKSEYNLASDNSVLYWYIGALFAMIAIITELLYRYVEKPIYSWTLSIRRQLSLTPSPVSE
jgi:peptidoglycan/LPS O-acetylase OafA/YrhL